jgi:hypothetical protein
MCQPKGFEAPGKEHMVCKLKLALYGLKQAGREWYELLQEIMMEIGFSHCQVEHAVFHRYQGDDVLIVAVDVDNMTIAGNSRHAIQTFKTELSQHVNIKDMGDLKWLLGIKVKRDWEKHTISFSQHAYILKILKRFNLQDTKPLSTPLNPNHSLSLTQCPSTPQQYDAMCRVPYHEAIGSLMYTVLGTHADIMFAVTFLSQFMQNPGQPHWEEVKHVFRYLKATIGYKLTIGN